MSPSNAANYWRFPLGTLLNSPSKSGIKEAPRGLSPLSSCEADLRDDEGVGRAAASNQSLGEEHHDPCEPRGSWAVGVQVEQGSLRFGGFPLFWWKKQCFKLAKCIF